LYDCFRVDGTPSEPAGTIIAIDAGRMLVVARDGCLSIGRVRVGDGAKVPVAESPLVVGDRLA
jgi:hypothetical protein